MVAFRSTAENPVLRLDMNHYRAGGRLRRRFLKLFHDSWHASGFVVIANSGIDPGVAQRAYDVSRQFFDLPLVTRLAYEHLELGGQRGYTREGNERAAGAAVADLKHFTHHGRQLPAGHPYLAAYKDNIQVAEVPGYDQAMAQAFVALDTFANEIAVPISTLLGKPKEWLNAFKEDGDSILRMIDYPPLHAINGQPGAVRAGQHTDIDLYALLVADRNLGLEVYVGGKWVPISIQAGDVVVNAGDMMALLSGGYFPSAWHRVVNPADPHERRMSMPFFVHPPRAAILRVLPRFQSTCTPARRDLICSAGWYLMHRLIQNNQLKSKNPYAHEGTNESLFPAPELPLAA